MGLFDQGFGNRNGLSPAAVALLGLLAVKGFENRDKLAGMLGGVLGGHQPDPNAPGGAQNGAGNGTTTGQASQGGLGGMLGGLADTMGGSSGTRGSQGSAMGQQGQDGGGLGGLLGGLAGALGGSASTGTVVSSGLGDVLKRFEQSGSGDVAQSWVKDGPNQEPAPQQVEQAVGSDLIDQLAQQTGLSRQELLARLTRELPKAVDQLTPDERVPTEQEVNSSLSSRA